MLCQGSQRDSWLRLVPEPERVLPRVVAALRSTASAPSAASIEAERASIEAVVLHGDADAWLGYLADVTRLVVVASDDPTRREEARIAAEVVRDHHRLLLGISEPLAARVANDRVLLEQLARQLGDQDATGATA